MEAVHINAKKKSEIAFLSGLAKKPGMPAKALTRKEMEDRQFARKIDAGMKTSTVKRSEVMKGLGK